MKINTWHRKEVCKLKGGGALLLGACFVATASAFAQQTNSPAKPASDTSSDTSATDFNNWVEFGVGGSIVTGNQAQYQRQSGLPAATAFGGINSFHFEEPVAKKGLFSIDGRGIFDNHDYDIKLELQHPDFGYLTGGFRQFREYYDGTGGFLPSNQLYFALPNQELSLDRGTAFVEGGLTLPDLPVLKLRYEHDYRFGLKDSTEWGTTTLTGPGQTVNAANQKKITPAFQMIDEKTDFIAADLTHTISTTDFGIGMRYEWIRNTDSQNVLFFPDQGLMSHTMTQTEGNKDDMINVHGFTDTRLGDHVEFTTGGSYTSLEDTIFGSRLDSPDTTTAPDTRFANLAGYSVMEQYEGDASVMWSPTTSIYVVPAVRVEKEDIAGTSTDNTVTGANVIGAQNTFMNNEARLDVGESLDFRYKGITNWVFYLRGDWEQNRANLQLTTIPNPLITNDWHQSLQQYTAGANWYPMNNLNFAGQYYHKFDNNRYENDTPTPSAYPGFMERQNFNVDDANFRLTWRPISQLAVIGRYDFQYTTIDMKGHALAEVQSGNNTTHQVGATISWTPLARLYLQVEGNYVMDHTQTPVETIPITAGIVQESLNDYWTVNGTIGLAIDDKTQVRASYVYYRAPDYVDNSPAGLPYGAGGEEHTISASLQRQITRRLTWGLQYSFTTYRDALFGGHLDFAAHTILSSLHFRF